MTDKQKPLEETLRDLPPKAVKDSQAEKVKGGAPRKGGFDDVEQSSGVARP